MIFRGGTKKSIFCFRSKNLKKVTIFAKFFYLGPNVMRFRNRIEHSVYCQIKWYLTQEINIWNDQRFVQVVIPAVAAVMNGVKISDCATTYVAPGIVQSVRRNLDSVVLSWNIIRRVRLAKRKEAEPDVKHAFSTNEPVLLHWDTNILPDIPGRSNLVDRIAILVTDIGLELFAVLKIDRGTGENQPKVWITKL